MQEYKALDLNIILDEVLNGVLAIEEENFYFRSAVEVAKANPSEYAALPGMLEQCVAIAHLASERFDHASCFRKYDKLRERVHQLVRSANRDVTT